MKATPIRLRIGYVDLLSGQYRTASNGHPELRDAVLASCSLPLVFPPVPLENGQELGVDGAVRSSTPLNPTEEDETPNVLRARLFESVDLDVAQTVIAAYNQGLYNALSAFGRATP